MLFAMIEALRIARARCPKTRRRALMLPTQVEHHALASHLRQRYSRLRRADHNPMPQ